MLSKGKKPGDAVLQIKKDYLQRHFAEVEELVAKWVGQLDLPPPLSPRAGERWRWSSPYWPALEREADSAHILRRHLRSRALWRHHSDWERLVDTAFRLQQELTEKAERLFAQRQHQQNRRKNARTWAYTPHYLGSALWVAFERAQGTKLALHYDAHQPTGVSYSNYIIEDTASASNLPLVQQEHQRLISTLGRKFASDLQQLGELWAQVQAQHKSMSAIASMALKSRDIFYPCRFCRRLWD